MSNSCRCRTLSCKPNLLWKSLNKAFSSVFHCSVLQFLKFEADFLNSIISMQVTLIVTAWLLKDFLRLEQICYESRCGQNNFFCFSRFITTDYCDFSKHILCSCLDVAVLQTLEQAQRRKEIYSALTSNMEEIFRSVENPPTVTTT